MAKRIASVSVSCQEVTPSSGEILPPASTGVAAQSAGPVVVGGGERSESLPCLYSNNSIKNDSEEHRTACILALCGMLAPYHKRQAEALFLNVERLINNAPSIGHVGFFTITTKDNVIDHREFQKRWNSFRTSYLARSFWFKQWIGTYERQKRGAWHLHLLVTLPYDIRSGCDFAQFERGNYRSAPPVLRQLWRDLRGKLPLYNFGRHELLPVKSNPQAMARYVGKYVSKHLGSRKEEDKGKRLIVASRDWIRHSCKFAWHTEGAQEWRRKVRVFAHALGCTDMDQLYNRLGHGWAYRYADSIFDADDLASTVQDHLPF